jgi:hypothetical protein
MEWVIVAILCLIAVPVVYRLLKRSVTLLGKLALIVVSIAVVVAAAFCLI